MASFEVTYNPKNLVIANILNAGETIAYAWVLDEMYQIIITKGTVSIGGNSIDAISVNSILAGTNLSVTATTDASFLTLLRPDYKHIVDQIMPTDSVDYYEHMQSYTPSWVEAGIPVEPPRPISNTTGNRILTSDELKTMVMEGWV